MRCWFWTRPSGDKRWPGTRRTSGLSPPPVSGCCSTDRDSDRRERQGGGKADMTEKGEEDTWLQTLQLKGALSRLWVCNNKFCRRYILHKGSQFSATRSSCSPLRESWGWGTCSREPELWLHAVSVWNRDGRSHLGCWRTGGRRDLSRRRDFITIFTISFRISGAPFTVTRWVWPEDWAGTKAVMTDILFREEEKWNRWIVFRVALLPFLDVTASPAVRHLQFSLTKTETLDTHKHMLHNFTSATARAHTTDIIQYQTTHTTWFNTRYTWFHTHVTHVSIPDTHDSIPNTPWFHTQVDPDLLIGSSPRRWEPLSPEGHPPDPPLAEQGNGTWPGHTASQTETPGLEWGRV